MRSMRKTLVARPCSDKLLIFWVAAYLPMQTVAYVYDSNPYVCNLHCPSIMNYQDLLDRIYAAVNPLVMSGENGVVASYIPELAGVNARQFGMAIVTLEGQTFSVGAAQQPFSIQSISKLFALCLAMHGEGDSVWKRVGRESLGNAFNSLVLMRVNCVGNADNTVRTVYFLVFRC